MGDEVYTSQKNGSLFIQVGGPNTQPYFVGCADLDDIVAPKGGITLLQCIDVFGNYKTVGATNAPPEVVTTSIGTYLGRTASWLEQIKCPATLFVNMRCKGKADQFNNWERSFGLVLQQINQETYSGLVKKDTSEASMHKVDVQALPPVMKFFSLTAVRQTTTEASDLIDVAFDNEDRCASGCGPALTAGQKGTITSEALAASPANTADVLFTADGAAWAAGATDPFAGGYDIGAVVRFAISPDVTRILVARGETNPAAPAQVKYSDDEGDTWSALVDVGAVNGQYAIGPHVLVALDQYNIWLATSGGYIYKSEDGGASWTAQTSGGVTVKDFKSLWMADVDYGLAGAADDVILRTLDGGETWSAVTATGAGDDITSLAIAENFVWVGTDGGEWYYSGDKGITWAQRTIPGIAAGGSVAAIDFLDGLFGITLHNTAAPLGTIWMTRDGGFTWENIDEPANAGLNSVFIVSPTLAYIVGNVSGGTGMIIKVFGG